MSKQSKMSIMKEKTTTNSMQDGQKENPAGNKHQLQGQNCALKECLKNPRSSNFNGIHYNKVRELSKSSNLNANEKGSGKENTNEKSNSSRSEYEFKKDKKNSKVKFLNKQSA